MVETLTISDPIPEKQQPKHESDSEPELKIPTKNSRKKRMIESSCDENNEDGLDIEEGPKQMKQKEDVVMETSSFMVENTGVSTEKKTPLGKKKIKKTRYTKDVNGYLQAEDYESYEDLNEDERANTNEAVKTKAEIS